MSQSPLLSVIDPKPPHSQRPDPGDGGNRAQRLPRVIGFSRAQFTVISQAKFLRLRNSAQDILGVNFCWKPQEFLWVLIFNPIRPSPSLEIRSIRPLGSQRQPNRFKTTLRNTKKRYKFVSFIPHDKLTDEVIFFSFLNISHMIPALSQLPKLSHIQ